MADTDGVAVGDGDAADAAGSEAETVGSGLEGAGLDAVAEADVDGVALGVGDAVGVAGLVGVVEVTGLGVGEGFLDFRGDGDGDGDAGTRVGDATAVG